MPTTAAHSPRPDVDFFGWARGIANSEYAFDLADIESVQSTRYNGKPAVFVKLLPGKAFRNANNVPWCGAPVNATYFMDHEGTRYPLLVAALARRDEAASE